ncbi:MAG TPA: ABC transporter permease subunit [Oscillospiraceae bacterium]|nr:ABC transporter permease subunit [Oscillospiraceae bacterium]HPK34943.1 ABC transporter permease subunit [Oscillospiraceae bacterium]HPR75348.1 ABC transporter permease subunit [Oscillospiraceae bacterium]
MRAIIKREFSSYFAHPVGYLFIGVTFLMASFSFFIDVFLYGTTDISPVFSSLFGLMYLIVPLITMRLLSEEKRHKTEQIFYTSPVTMTEVVLGKFFGACLVYIVATAIVFVHQVVLAFYGSPEWGLLICRYLGLVLLGGLLIGIGLVVSALTESQAVAAIITLAVTMIMDRIDSLTQSSSSETLIKITEWISPGHHFTGFFNGILNVADIFYYISMTGLLLFIAVRILDRKRWA